MILIQNVKIALLHERMRAFPCGSAMAAMLAAGCVTAASLNCHQTETMRH
jgi:hypothetical protein